MGRPVSPTLQRLNQAFQNDMPSEQEAARYEYYLNNMIPEKDLIKIDDQEMYEIISLADKETGQRFFDQNLKKSGDGSVLEEEVRNCDSGSRPTTPKDWVYTAKEVTSEAITDELFRELKSELALDFELA